MPEAIVEQAQQTGNARARRRGGAALATIAVLGTCAALAAAPGDPAAGGMAARGPVGAESLLPRATPAETARRHLDASRAVLEAACTLAEERPERAMEAYQAAAEEAWNAVWTCPGAAEVLGEATLLYDEALAGLLGTAVSLGRLDGRGLVIGDGCRRQCIPLSLRGLTVDPSRIDAVVVGPPPCDSRVRRSHVRPGFGVPVSVRIAADDSRFAPPRQSVAATAVLRFPLPGDPDWLRDIVGPLGRDPAPAVLDLADPVEIAAVRIGPARPLLAADLTAPLLDMLEATPPAGIEGFIQPYGRGDTRPRLERLEPHRPGRIPVVFIHGLASDPGTWFDLLNELRAWPPFHRHFEPWLYQYPTGASFLQSSASLRGELAAARARLDPAGRDPGLQRMVLVGHSMGGLHAKLQVVDSGDALWDAVSTEPFEAVRMPPALRRQVAPTYFFHPAPFVRRVVFVATPHAGSSLAARAVGRLASVTVRQPAEALRAHRILRDANPDAVRPEYRSAPPTTIDVLEPQSSILQAIRALRPPAWVSLHTILGNGAVSPLEGPGDAVVSVGSARHPDVVSELEVPAIHTKVHHHPRSVLELQRILACHLAESGPLDPPAAASTEREEAAHGPVAGGDPVANAGTPARASDLHPAVSVPVEVHRWSAVSLPRR